MRVREAIVGLALLSAGCPHRDTASAPSATGQGARPTLHLVARLLEPNVRLAKLEDGTVVLDTRLFVHALDPRESPRRIGDASAYAPLLQHDESSPRWADPERSSPRGISGTATHLELAVRSPAGLFVWDGHWTFAQKALVEIELHGTRAKPAPTPDILGERDTCVPLPSADPSATWVDCRRAGSSTREIFVQRSGGWEPVSLAGEGGNDAPVAIARDGSAWLVSNENDTEVLRLAAGRIERFAVPDQAGPRRASYRGASQPREVTNPEPEAARHVRAIVPARDGTMWILTSGPTGGALYRAGGERPAAVTVIGSVLDQRAEIEATQPRKKWVGHCDTVFVPLVRGRGNTLPIEELREPNLRPVLTSANAVVVGWLGNERVAGPLFTTADDDSRERMIEQFVGTLAQNPATAPEPTCTLPVLERTFDL